MSDRFRTLRWQALVATWLCYAGFYVTRKVFSVVKAPLKEILAADDLSVSHIWTAYLVAYMLGQFLAAALGRRFSSRTLLIAGMGTSVVCNVGIGLVLPQGPAAYWPLLLMMVVQGVAQATGWPHTIAIVANWTHRLERGTVMSVWATCYQIGAVVARALAAFMFGWLGLLWAFWGSSAMLLGVVAVFVFWGHERPEDMGEQLPAAPATLKAARMEQTSSTQSDGRFYVTVIAMGLIYFGFKFLRYAVDSWSALILREHFSLSIAYAGYYSTAFDWVGFLGVLASGPISDRWFGGARTPLVFVMALGCFGANLLLWLVGLSSLWVFVALLGLVGFMAMGPDALLSGAGAMDVGSARRAALAAGIINGVGSVGPIVQEPVIGWLKTYDGLDSVFLVLVVVSGISAVGAGVFWQVLRRRAVEL